MLDYILPIAASVYALLQLAKDWEKHQTTLRRTAALVLVLLLGVGSATNTYYAKRRAAQQHSDDQAKIAELKKAVEVSNQDQKSNTEQFVSAFGALSKQVTDLQTQVTTEKLQSKLAGLQTDLLKTQEALAPGPKAELTFTFTPFNNPPANSSTSPTPVTDVDLPMNSDGTVHIEGGALNLTSVDAADVDLNIQICDRCKYAKEPANTVKLAGFPDTIRLLKAPHVQGMQALTPIILDIIGPPDAKNIPVGFTYRCSTCVVTRKASLGMVHISGR